MASAAKYAHVDYGDGERPAVKDCAEAGRQCVRCIQQYPILSVEWFNLGDELKKLVRLVQLEGRMLPNTKVSEAQGRNTESEGTLWDQENHETAIRVLVEEAKVNLCLRIMNDFKAWSYNSAEKAKALADTAQAHGVGIDKLEPKLFMFEENMGTLLWRAFVHVETLQLMDIPLLLEHCAMVLNFAVSTDAPANTKMQETVVLYYFASLMRHAEALNNSELLAKTRELNIVHLATSRILTHLEEYPLELLWSGAMGFSALCDNEDFGTCWEDFFRGPDGAPDVEAMRRFVQLEDNLAELVLREKPEKKKDIRPLLDFCKRLRAKCG
eukprot:TRINITY_DN4785_c3_g1_i1.p1 TRINITY_DN4785_c3_g1~~TRINITY_DN4785_c3_g1_i1.p1  ORF type:complete len:326 (+),score=95.27 TRINITY_DN4785_c3_g1_i1:97-1074(+)